MIWSFMVKSILNGTKKDGEDLHAHIIVSHKTKNNGKSISPMTNHTGKKNTGAAQGDLTAKSGILHVKGLLINVLK